MRMHPKPIGPRRGALQLRPRRVPRMEPDDRHDRPTWPNHPAAPVLQVMPPSTITGTGAVPLLKTPDAADKVKSRGVIAGTAIGTTVLVSVEAMADTDRPLAPPLGNP